MIVAAGALQPMIECSLPTELKDVLAGRVDADLEHAPVAKIADAVQRPMNDAECERERALMARLEQALGTSGAGAAGLDQVLSTLEQHRVELLLVPERSNLRAGLCPRCVRLWSDGERSCPLDGAALAEVDAVAHAIGKAARQSVPVLVVRHTDEALSRHGRIAALLKW